ncbi:heterokaryon incompatibility, partial [Decorospora gaudefroyi]
YSARSYTWGDQRETKYIEINGHTMQIGKNLWTALRHLRHMSHSQTLWVDSICIDQSSVEEKSHQIPIMAFIYGRAKQVIVWLGQHQT